MYQGEASDQGGATDDLARFHSGNRSTSARIKDYIAGQIYDVLSQGNDLSVDPVSSDDFTRALQRAVS